MVVQFYKLLFTEKSLTNKNFPIKKVFPLPGESVRPSMNLQMRFKIHCLIWVHTRH